MDKYEISRTNLKKLKSEFNSVDKASFNEATTRFRFIDRLLTECLGWEANKLTCEDNYDGKYTDYTLSFFRPVAVIEAKKTGDSFELPIGQKDLFQPIKSLCKDNDNIKKAIEQVKGYCQDRSIPIAVVSNGWQLIAFIATRTDSIPPLEGNALIIPSLDVFLKEFKEVWNCLSEAGFEEEYLLRKLTGNTELELPQKLSSTIHQYPGNKNRNPFQTELEIISDLVLEDVIKEKEIETRFLESCYCKSGVLSSYSLVSKAILSTRYDYLLGMEKEEETLQQVANKKGLSGDLVDLFANSLSKRPVLLIGDIGVGKSTFIDYLRLVEAPNIFEKAISFKIDLGLKAIISLDIKEAIVEIIKEQLSAFYDINIENDDFVRNCYFVDLEKFKDNVKVKRLYDINPEKAAEKEIDFLESNIANKAEHLKRSLEHICKSQKKQIILFIDNCDQRSDADQETAFLISQEFASSWPMIVFVSLRPETFHRTKRESGALSGYPTKTFTIPPPKIDDVIRKRLKFAQEITSGKVSLSKLNNLTSFSTLHTLIDIFLFSLDKNEELLIFLDNISNDNIRKAIELIKKFFGSGHVDMKKILEIHKREGRYNIPTHELLRSVIFSDNIYYSPRNSEIINVFEVRHHKPNEHFLLLVLISLLDDYSKNNRNHGFISVKETYIYLQGAGFTPTQIDSVLNYAYAKKMFEISQKGDVLESENSDLQIRATNLAIYHLRFLTNCFTYIDAIIVDTPIFDNSSRGKILNVMDIKERLERAKIFKDYLDQQWAVAKINSSHFNWTMFSNELKIDIENIEKRLK